MHLENDMRHVGKIIVVDVADDTPEWAGNPSVRQAYKGEIDKTTTYLKEMGILPCVPEVVMMTGRQAMAALISENRAVAHPLLLIIHDKRESESFGQKFCEHFVRQYYEKDMDGRRPPPRFATYALAGGASASLSKILGGQEFQDKLTGVLVNHARKKPRREAPPAPFYGVRYD